MRKLREIHNLLINSFNTDFQRSYINKLPWNVRLFGIKGSRGVGKTTLLLQYINKNYGLSEEAFYISLDDLYFTENKVVDFVDVFVKKGGKHLFIDEVHKYPNWAIEIKNIYDYYPELKVVFTGSSLLQILNSSVDLSRRALLFEMRGLSFREYLNFTTKNNFEILSLDEILNNHLNISATILKKIKPLQFFESYYQRGYYPFAYEDKQFYYQRILEILNMIVEFELPLLRNIDIAKTYKIKHLLYIISQSAPFKPNVSKLATKIGVSRNTLVEYIKSLSDANILNILNKDTHGISLLQKPEKIYLENTNIAFALGEGNANMGNLRETFILNQLLENHNITYPEKGDFLIDNKYLFEVGGKNKTNKQIAGIKNAYIAADDIEYGYKNVIPLWLFGFLY